MVTKSSFSDYIDYRLFEWVMAVSMLFLAAQILTLPDTLRASAFRWVLTIMPEHFIGFTLLLCGAFRVSALVVNGNSHVVGPWIRAVGAVMGAVMWVQFGTALIRASLEVDGYHAPGTVFWFMFTVAELRVAYRAILDVRTVH